jgi:cyclopropane-fatty-acyl-phospholipid synthase
MLGIGLAETGRLPDFLIRHGIRAMLRQRLREISCADCEGVEEANRGFRVAQRRGPIALHTDRANEQHYEVPPAFFGHVLGPRLKYSCGLWPQSVDQLAIAEELMLALTCDRAGIRDGATVLDLGCGWGSLSLWIAERYPRARVLAVSNSKLQRESILGRCQSRGLDNVEVVTADVNDFMPQRRFDRVVSVEMFEHVRNHPELLRRIAGWLEPGGKLFVHHFAHRERAYPYEAATAGDDDWMARHFFSGGMMPSDDLLLHYQDDLVVERKWRVNGTHYQKTSEAWLERLDARRERVMPILEDVYGAAEASRWFHRWRLFFLACSELFGYRGGNVWWVSHVLMARREIHR